MDAFLIRGPSRLSGTLSASGAKNAALPALAASLLTADPVSIGNLPAVADVRTMEILLGGMGVVIERSSAERATLRADRITSTEAPYDLVRTMRASILVLGPLLSRFGEARVSLPGGCAIGVRPVDLHLAAMEAMGARIAVENGYIHAHVSRVSRARGRLAGTQISFPLPTVTGTENVLFAAALARGCTVIHNAALEPEVVDTARLLSTMGARIEGAGTPTITVEGVECLGGTGDVPHAVVPDRIETGTFLAAGAITGGDVTVTNARPGDLEAFLGALRRAGAEVETGTSSIRVHRRGSLRATDIRTAPHPGFPTDLQAQFLALMTQAEGASRIVETVFENRFLHVGELIRLGANVKLDGHTAVVRGPTALEGAPVTASDLRASAALVLGGLVGRGETRVRRIYHLDRGYARMDERLRSLGASVERIPG
ncbi:MAG TPA: UDP-N-acetylglucosamine 1-carboxyvinyltransferase [Thermoanaerobaculia bacterium]|nr:UDP-N-acetylglucosamine 1-carboxyvinyltransferase [Thermoanaerobaculia bacterium]